MLLGIDWGEKKIGLALGEHEVSIASAFGALPHDRNVFEAIHKIVDEHDVDLIVIGKSAHMSQSDNVKLIEEFGNKCCEHIGVAVKFVPEMFSTREAQANLKKAGKKNIDKIDDAESARIILQQYLDAENTKI